MNRGLLEQPFPPEAIRQREGNFGHLIDYIEGHSVIQRLNDALDGNWSFEVVEHHVLKDLDEIVVLGKLSTSDLVKSQLGASSIKRTRETGEIICMAAAFKAAATDALKKCATLLGVGLDLYGGEASESRKADSRRGQRRGGSDRTPRTPAGSPDDRGSRVTAKQHQYLLSLAKTRGMSTGQLSPTDIDLIGFIDLLIEGDSRRLVVVDHKTAAQAKTQTDVDADLQMTTGGWSRSPASFRPASKRAYSFPAAGGCAPTASTPVLAPTVPAGSGIAYPNWSIPWAWPVARSISWLTFTMPSSIWPRLPTLKRTGSGQRKSDGLKNIGICCSKVQRTR